MKELTPRERDIYALVAKGLTNVAIALSLGVGDSVVRVYIRRIMHKLAVSNRVQIALTFHGIEFWKDGTP